MKKNKSNIKQGILLINDADEFIRIMADIQKQYNSKHNGVKKQWQK